MVPSVCAMSSEKAFRRRRTFTVFFGPFGFSVWSSTRIRLAMSSWSAGPACTSSALLMLSTVMRILSDTSPGKRDRNRLSNCCWTMVALARLSTYTFGCRSGEVPRSNCSICAFMNGRVLLGTRQEHRVQPRQGVDDEVAAGGLGVEPAAGPAPAAELPAAELPALLGAGLRELGTARPDEQSRVEQLQLVHHHRGVGLLQLHDLDGHLHVPRQPVLAEDDVQDGLDPLHLFLRLGADDDHPQLVVGGDDGVLGRLVNHQRLHRARRPGRSRARLGRLTGLGRRRLRLRGTAGHRPEGHRLGVGRPHPGEADGAGVGVPRGERRLHDGARPRADPAAQFQVPFGLIPFRVEQH